MTAWTSGDVVANGLRIHYYRTGGNKPPLVLSHGATDSGLCWTRLARALESDYDVIMPDARGHGLSEEPRDGYSSDARAADLAEFVQALGLEKPAVGGHSMGAQTTFYLLANYPGLVRCAILEDPVFRPRGEQPSEADRQARSEQMRKAMEENRAIGRDQIIAKGRAQHPAWSEEEFGPWADAKLNVKPSFSLVRSPERLFWWSELPKQATPTLLVTADPDKGAIVPPEVAQEAARLQPNLKVVRLSGAGHNIRREQFEGFLQAVRAFLAEA
jgi:pimeloyl-ACP methyl ester carboxylesterase